MSSTTLLGRISNRIRVLALFLVAVLVAAAFISLTQRDSHAARPPHFLGMRQLQLDAFNGRAHLFLRIPPITPAGGTGHATDIAVSRFSLNIDAPSGPVGAGPPARAHVSDLTFQKLLDKDSTKLFAATAAGTHFKTATLFILPAVQRDPEELEYKLTQSLVSSDHASATGDGSVEIVTLQFTKIEIDYLRNGRQISSALYTLPAVQ
jgi:type VI protein secretion system component Hcp